MYKLIAALVLFSACSNVRVEVATPTAPTPTAQPAITATAEEPWYSTATLRNRACRRLDAATLASCVAVFSSIPASNCTTNTQTGDTTCDNGVFVQAERDGSRTAFVGEEFVAELAPGVTAGIWGARFADGVVGTCDLSVQPTVCVQAEPERR